MVSYAVVDRIEEDRYVVCEVELVELEESNSTDLNDKEFIMMDILKVDALKCMESIEENDVIVVEHDAENIIRVLYKDDEEKQRRLDEQ